MKIFNSLAYICISFFIDLSANALTGYWWCFTTPLLYSYYTSFFAPKMIRVLAAFFVIMQALLYNHATALLYVYVVSMFVCASFFNKRLLSLAWVRLLLTGLYFLIFLILFYAQGTG